MKIDENLCVNSSLFLSKYPKKPDLLARIQWQKKLKIQKNPNSELGVGKIIEPN